MRAAILALVLCACTPATSGMPTIEPVNVTWKNEIAECVEPTAVGGQYLEDAWGAKHFVIGASLAGKKPVLACCAPSTAIDYEATAGYVAPTSENAYMLLFTSGAAAFGPEAITLKVPMPGTNPGETTEYTIKLSCGPHD